MLKIWPGRDTWYAECGILSKENEGHFERDPNRAIHGPRGQRWCNKGLQTKGEWFRVHLGKSRFVSRFILPAHEVGGYPMKYKVKVMADDDGYWIDYGVHDGPIDYSFGRPIKISRIHVEIEEAYCSEHGEVYGWSICDVQVFEPVLPIRYLNRKCFNRKWAKPVGM